MNLVSERELTHSDIQIRFWVSPEHPQKMETTKYVYVLATEIYMMRTDVMTRRHGRKIHIWIRMEEWGGVVLSTKQQERRATTKIPATAEQRVCGNSTPSKENGRTRRKNNRRKKVSSARR